MQIFFVKEAGICCQKVSYSVLIGPFLALVKAFMRPPGEIHRGYPAAGKDQLPLSYKQTVGAVTP